MPELNFDDLRQAVESDTYLPEFSEVRRRARRHRRWRRLLTVSRALGVLVLAAPVAAIGGIVFSHAYPAGPAADQADGGHRATGTTGRAVAVARANVLAVDGIDPEHTYALVDVCVLKQCDLQLSQVNPTAAASVPQRTGLLRNSPTDTVTDPRITVENPTTVIISARIDDAPRQYLTLSVDPSAGTIHGVRPVQTSLQGPVRVVTGTNGTAMPLTDQPPLTSPVLGSATKGWWVLGTTPAGQLAVSVSRDHGHTWSTEGLGVVPDASTPGGTRGASLATIDGRHVYVLVRTDGQMSLLGSNDGGATWGPLATSQAWPDADSYGLVATTSGGLIAWFTSGRNTTAFESTDGGGTFSAYSGVAGPVVATGGQYVVLGLAPSTSTNGVDWASAYVPYVAMTTGP